MPLNVCQANITELNKHNINLNYKQNNVSQDNDKYGIKH